MDDAAREVAAMQFAGGKSVAELAAEWERDAAWVEESIRRALLELIPRRSGGLKPSRAEMRAERRQLAEGAQAEQAELDLERAS